MKTEQQLEADLHLLLPNDLAPFLRELALLRFRKMIKNKGPFWRLVQSL